MNIAVTGSAGFLGNVLVRQLIHHDHQVTAIDLKPEQQSLENLPIKLVSADVRDQDRLLQIFKENNIEIVFHLANMIRITKDHDGLMHSINVDGTRSAAKAARLAKVRRFIFVSSIHAYSIHIGNNILDENCKKALDSTHFDYDCTKALAELALIIISYVGQPCTDNIKKTAKQT